MAEVLPRAALRAAEHLVRRGLRGIWLRGRVPSGAFVWAANHNSWWDPFVAAALLGRCGRLPALLVAQRNLTRFGVARLLGGFGTEHPRQGLDALRRGRTLVIFPEGELRPPGQLGDLARGAAWFARRAGVPLCASATRVVLRGHQAPEAYVHLSTVEGTAAAGATACLAVRLGTTLSELDGLLAGAAPRSPLPGFTLAVSGRRSIEERLERLPWPRR